MLGTGWLLRMFDVYVVDGAVNGVGLVTRPRGGPCGTSRRGVLQNYGWAMYAGALVIAAVTSRRSSGDNCREVTAKN